MTKVNVPDYILKYREQCQRVSNPDGCPGIHTKEIKGSSDKVSKAMSDFFNKMDLQYPSFEIMHISDSFMLDGTCKTIVYKI